MNISREEPRPARTCAPSLGATARRVSTRLLQHSATIEPLPGLFPVLVYFSLTSFLYIPISRNSQLVSWTSSSRSIETGDESTRYTIGDASDGSAEGSGEQTALSSAHSRRVVKFATDEEDETVYRVEVDESLYPQQRAAAPSASEAERALTDVFHPPIPEIINSTGSNIL